MNGLYSQRIVNNFSAHYYSLLKQSKYKYLDCITPKDHDNKLLTPFENENSIDLIPNTVLLVLTLSFIYVINWGKAEYITVNSQLKVIYTMSQAKYFF